MMAAFINPPPHIPFYLKFGLWMARRKTGKDLLPARLLAWYPKAALSSGFIELSAANGKNDLSPRLLKLLRIKTSLTVSCPFCIDMNSFEYQNEGITLAEINSLKENADPELVESFSLKERIAMNYSAYMSFTPPVFPPDFISLLQENFNEKEIVIMAATIAQVNYWARLIQGLGIPPAGFSDLCSPAKKEDGK